MQRQPQLLDTVACNRDFPELSLEQSSVGTIVECHGNDAYEVEFSDDDGIPTLTTVITLRNSVLDWDNGMQAWILKDFSEGLKKAFQSLEGRGQSFMGACLAEAVLPKDIILFIDAWSETYLPQYHSLPQVLGMTPQEFDLWERDRTLLPTILQARRQNISIESLVGDRSPHKAGSF